MTESAILAGAVSLAELETEIDVTAQTAQTAAQCLRELTEKLASLERHIIDAKAAYERKEHFYKAKIEELLNQAEMKAQRRLAERARSIDLSVQRLDVLRQDYQTAQRELVAQQQRLASLQARRAALQGQLLQVKAA